VWSADLLEWFAKAEERELPTPAEWSSEASQMGTVVSATTQRR
jgi:hypothetical protein